MTSQSQSNMETQDYYINRLEELTQRESSGQENYPNVFEISRDIHSFNEQYKDQMEKGETIEDQIESIAGRVMSIRRSGKKLFFIDIQSNGSNVQVLGNLMFYSNQDNFKPHFEQIQRGDIIGAVGLPHRSKAGELSLLPKLVKVLAPCLRVIPSVRNDLTDKEIRYRQRYLDLICNTDQMKVYRTRSRIISYLREFLLRHDFIEVETPMMNQIHGGASAKPFVTHHNDLKMDLFMRIAPELYLKRLIVGGFEKVFEIGKQFRNESIDLTHNPEFTTCEFYWAYKDYEYLMTFTEQLLSNMVYTIFGTHEVQYQMDNGEEVTISFKAPFRRFDMVADLEKNLGVKIPRPLDGTDANRFLEQQCEKHGITCSAPRTNTRLLDKLVAHFLEEQCVQPTFIINHPVMMSPLAKQHRDNNELTERFELFVAKNELCNAYTELNDPRIQRQRFEDQLKQKSAGDGEAQPYDEDFCQALEYGLPPTAGWGIGLDRLTMFLTGINNIKEVLLFPAMRPVPQQS